MIERWIRSAAAGEPVWLGDVRAQSAAAPDSERVILRLTLCDGSRRDFVHFLPAWRGEEQRRFVREVLCACVFNTLSALSGRELRLFFRMDNAELSALLHELPELFQVDAAPRRGCGKAVSVANRLSAALGGGRFAFAFEDLAGYAPLPEELPAPSAGIEEVLSRALERAGRGLCCGLDVGGTDVKLALERGGELIDVRELDWDPSSFSEAEQLIEPLLRLLRSVLDEHGETRFDAIGVSFPDVVVRDRIVGGETPKTRGMRKNPRLDYEADFARLTHLRDRLLTLCHPGAAVHLVNDGSMAAFTAAMELWCGGHGAALSGGVLAHSLGTDLGTGWLLSDGRVPELPLEVYDFLLDLGSRPQRGYAPEDLRSVCNENSGLPGVRRYLGQAACFRMAQELSPALLEGFTERRGETLLLRSQPKDLRKPCLEHLMLLAEQGQPEAEEIFRRIGRHLAHVSKELDFLLQPTTRQRFLFGRFVKRRRCFELIAEGCAALCPELELVAADEGLSDSPLMRQLAGRSPGAVARCGQAVGAIYYALAAEPDR